MVAQLANRINQPHVIDCYMRKVHRGGFDRGVEHVMSQPLASRMTPEEKERVKRIHMEYKRLYAKHKDSVFRWAEVYKGKYELLESIFGADFFKEI